MCQKDLPGYFYVSASFFLHFHINRGRNYPQQIFLTLVKFRWIGGRAVVKAVARWELCGLLNEAGTGISTKVDLTSVGTYFWPTHPFSHKELDWVTPIEYSFVF